MEYQATAKHVRVSTRKVRLVADSIRALAPGRAVDILYETPKSGAGPLRKAIQSALANAAAKKADPGVLRFKTIEIMGGTGMKRWHAVSRGQAHPYKKRTTHVRVVLTDEKPEIHA
ncbi:50S ribosomal protein L22 [Patescibacteria group bacterium]|nr:50S ribosomal protein L22 [Patescibacteria group bacterium]